jgi:hypothetical protein
VHEPEPEPELVSDGDDVAALHRRQPKTAVAPATDGPAHHRHALPGTVTIFDR